MATLSAEASELVRYWPTSVARLAEDKFLVAGKSSSGLTILEVWSLSLPSVSADGLSLAAATRSSVERVYEAYAAGRDMVSAIAPDLYGRTPDGRASRALVQFYDSRDIYSFDVTTRAFTLLASPIAPSGGLHAPGVAGRSWSAFEAREHVTLGYVYILRVRRGVFDGSAQDSTVVCVTLTDSDRDGDLDAAATLTVSQWGAAGFSNLQNWVQ